MIAYYAIVGLKSGATWFEVFSPAQIAALRAANRRGDIRDPEHWMERKTALKQVLKLAPKSTKLAQTYAVDEKPATITQAVRVAHEEPLDNGERIDEETGEVFDGEIVTDTQDDAMFAQDVAR